MKLQKQSLTTSDSEIFKTKIKFKRRNVDVELLNETDSFDVTLALANTILDDLRVYEDRARSALMSEHVALEEGQGIVLSGISFSEDKYVSFAYYFTDGSGLPIHTFFIDSWDKGQRFEA